MNLVDHIHGNRKKNEHLDNYYLNFLNKLAEISLADKHLLEEVDSESLIELKSELRKLYAEESRLRKSLSTEKNKLV